MSISSEITRINTNIANSYTAVENKNGTLPQVQNSNNLASAIDSIQSSNIIGATAEGESLSLTNTKAMPYSDYVVEGKSEQEGTPSPSIPSEIHSVADDVNLFDLKNFLSDRNVSYTENEDGSLTFITSSALYLSPLQFSNEDIIVSMSGILTTLEEMSNAKIEILNSNNTVVGQINLSNSKIENITGSKLRFNMTSNKTITLRNIKLQKGSTSTPYSPYNQGTVTIKQRGKNLLDASKFASATSNGITLSFNSDGNIVLNQTATAQANFNSSHIDMDGSINTGDMVTLSGGSENVTVAIQTFTSDDTYIGASRDSGSTVKYTIPNNASKYAFNIRIPSGTVLSDYVLKPQLEKDSKATTYEPYQANNFTFQTEPLRSLPNGVKDTIEADGIHRRVGRVVLDGTENWDNYSLVYGSTEIVQCRLILSSNCKSRVGLSDRFLVIADYSATEHIVIGGALNNAVFIHINKSRLSTEDITGFKNWLSTHNTEVLYQLAEEIIEPLTQNQATTMLDIIKTGSYEGTTNIYTDEDVKPTIEVDYYKYGETGGLPTVENEKLIFDKELQIDREELIF